MNHSLLDEIHSFADGKNAYHREEPPEGKKSLKTSFRSLLSRNFLRAYFQ